MKLIFEPLDLIAIGRSGITVTELGFWIGQTENDYKIVMAREMGPSPKLPEYLSPSNLELVLLGKHHVKKIVRIPDETPDSLMDPLRYHTLVSGIEIPPEAFEIVHRVRKTISQWSG